MLYFAYGANTNSNVMLSRIPQAKFYARYNLIGWKLQFSGHIQTEKSFLDIIKEPNSVVAGVLWDIPIETKPKLDVFEDLYYHFPFILENGQKAFSYVMVKNKVKRTPEKDYLTKVLIGYKEFKLPIKDIIKAYQETLV